MENFKTIKEEFVSKCKEHSACKPEFKRVLASTNESELLTVVMDNFSWCYEQEKIIDIAWLLLFEQSIREYVGIFVNLNCDRKIIEKNCCVISNDGSKIGYVISYGSSNIGYVRSYDSSNIGEVRSYDSSKIGYVISNDSSNIGYVRSYDSSNIGEVRSYDSSKIGYVISNDSSKIGYVISNGSSNIGYVRSYDSSNIGYVISNDSSKIGYVRSYGSSNINTYGIASEKISVSDYGCVKSLADCKIYLKKDKFIIQLID